MDFFITSTIMTQIVIIFTDVTDLLIISCRSVRLRFAYFKSFNPLITVFYFSQLYASAIISAITSSHANQYYFLVSSKLYDIMLSSSICQVTGDIYKVNLAFLFMCFTRRKFHPSTRVDRIRESDGNRASFVSSTPALINNPRGCRFLEESLDSPVHQVQSFTD